MLSNFCPSCIWDPLGVWGCGGVWGVGAGGGGGDKTCYPPTTPTPTGSLAFVVGVQFELQVVGVQFELQLLLQLRRRWFLL